jgi:hypothetical protein
MDNQDELPVAGCLICPVTTVLIAFIIPFGILWLLGLVFDSVSKAILFVLEPLCVIAAWKVCRIFWPGIPVTGGSKPDDYVK